METCKAAVGDGFQVGDILERSWGYDQTNIDYYRITRRSASSVWIIPIGQTMIPGSAGFMSERVLPDPKQELAWSMSYARRCLNTCGAGELDSWPDTCPQCGGPTERYITSEDRTPKVKRIVRRDGAASSITMASWSSAFPYEGRARYQSHYA